MIESAYQEFLDAKRILSPACGVEVDESELNPMLMPFQRDVLMWGLRRGKAANFLHTGLGKGPIQLGWCDILSRRHDRPTLLAAPLAVAEQFQWEAEKFHHDVTICESDADVRPGINITNYDRLDKFDVDRFIGVAEANGTNRCLQVTTDGKSNKQPAWAPAATKLE